MTPANIKLNRRGAAGDVLCCSAIIRAAKKKYPKTGLFFQTDHPGALANNPHLHNPAQKSIQHNNAVTWDLSGFTKEHFGWHLIDVLASNYFKQGEVEHKLEMFPAQADYAWAGERMPQTPAITIAPGPGKYLCRNWSQERWNAIIEWLLPNYPVVIVGTKDRHSYRLHPQVFDLRGETNEMQLAAVVDLSRLVVSLDNFVLHVAGAMRTKRIGLFGVTRPELILCDFPYIACCSDPEHLLTGARHKVQSIVEIKCDVRNNPMNDITVDAVIDVLQMCGL